MNEQCSIKVTLTFVDPQLDSEAKDQQVRNLMRELKEIDEVDEVHCVEDPNPPSGNKSFVSFLIGVLSAEVSLENAEKLFNVLGDRLRNKPIKIKVESQGRSLEVEAYSVQELNSAINSAKSFLE